MLEDFKGNAKNRTKSIKESSGPARNGLTRTALKPTIPTG